MNKKWSKALIVEAIKKLHRKNVGLSAGYISKNYVSLFNAASSHRYFNSWAIAVQEAGINYNKILEESRNRRSRQMMKWSKIQILEEVKKGVLLNLVTTYRDRLDLYSAARREFGSWKQALEEAGCKVEKNSNKNLELTHK